MIMDGFMYETDHESKTKMNVLVFLASGPFCSCRGKAKKNDACKAEGACTYALISEPSTFKPSKPG